MERSSNKDKGGGPAVGLILFTPGQLLHAPFRYVSEAADVDGGALHALDRHTLTGFEGPLALRRIGCPGRAVNFDSALVERALA